VFVAPVLDPSWRSAYEVTSEERQLRENALRRGALRRIGIFVGTAVVTAVVLSVVHLLLLGAAVLVAAAIYSAVALTGSAREREKVLGLAGDLVTRFDVGGTPADRQRLSTIVERLSASFGLDRVACMVVTEPVPNATLVVDRDGYSLVVTTGLMETFELIEIEGVVAHCFARQRLGYLHLSAGVASSPDNRLIRRAFDRHCSDFALRADEIAAVTIRYPVGLAAALRRTARIQVPEHSYFATSAFNAERVVWFDPYIDGKGFAEGDNNQAGVRASALEEW
jgi:Zn-dependent protease with chaperone function